MDDPIDTRSPTEPVAPGLRDLPPYLVAGNRFGSYGFGAGLSGLLLALAPFGHAVAWVLVLAAVVLGAVGFARYVKDGATNRDASIVGFATGWIGLTILLAQLAVSLNLPPEAYFYPGP